MNSVNCRDIFKNIHDFIYDFLTLFSLGLTVPAMTMAIMVLFTFHKEFILYKQAENPTKGQTIIAGIYRGFFGAVVDNAWWGAAWTFDYLGMEGPRNFFFIYGVVVNVVFRQGALIWSGFLHIKAGDLNNDELALIERAKRRTMKILKQSLVCGVIYILLLVVVKNAS